MKKSLLLITGILFITLTAGKAQFSGTTPVLWPGFFPGIGDLRNATTVEDTADNGSVGGEESQAAGAEDLYQPGDEIPADESGFSFEPLEVPALRLFPNPATDYFSVTEAENVDRLLVYNMTGRMLRAYSNCDDQPHFVGDLPDGLYLITLLSNQDGVIKTLRLLKRSVRP